MLLHAPYVHNVDRAQARPSSLLLSLLEYQKLISVLLQLNAHRAALRARYWVPKSHSSFFSASPLFLLFLDSTQNAYTEVVHIFEETNDHGQAGKLTDPLEQFP